MMTAIKTRMKNEKGLTLVELLAVIVILAIIAAIAVPSIGNIVENSRYNAVKADAMNVLSAANLYFVATPDDSEVTVTELLGAGYLDSTGKIPGSATINKVTGGNTISASTATGGAITYSGSKTLTLNAATLADINADTQKGSAAPDNKTIG